MPKKTQHNDTVAQILDDIAEIQSEFNEIIGEINRQINAFGDEYASAHKLLLSDNVRISDNRNIVERIPDLLEEVRKRFADRDDYERQQRALEKYVDAGKRHIVARRNKALVDKLRADLQEKYDTMSARLEAISIDGPDFQKARVDAARSLDSSTVNRVYTAVMQTGHLLAEQIEETKEITLEYDK